MSDATRAPTHVLVHGAWHGPWSWDHLVVELDTLGATTAVVDLPSSGQDRRGLGGLDADVDALTRLLDEVAGPKVVVGHSYGGQPVSQACAGRDDIAHLVYVCAFMLDVGESLVDALGGDLPDWFDVAEDGASVWPLRPEEIFYGDVAPEVAAACVDKLGHQSMASFDAALSRAAWQDTPSTYIICERDSAIPAAAQEQMSGRATAVQRMAASHSPFLSHPGELAGRLAAVV